ncbi:MAG: adenylyltransferase/cytidyltransferase family protein [Patescibacteria group bacterium]
MMKKKVLVFGVFDGLHPGHHHFLKAAKDFGDSIIVVVARDSSVSTLKNKQAIQSESDRLRKVGELDYVEESVLGDETLGSYEVLKTYQPDQICLGYDQDLLEKDLKERMSQGLLPQIETMRINAYRPEEFHSSLISGADVS